MSHVDTCSPLFNSSVISDGVFYLSVSSRLFHLWNGAALGLEAEIMDGLAFEVEPQCDSSATGITRYEVMSLKAAAGVPRLWGVYSKSPLHLGHLLPSGEGSHPGRRKSQGVQESGRSLET